MTEKTTTPLEDDEPPTGPSGGPASGPSTGPTSAPGKIGSRMLDTVHAWRVAAVPAVHGWLRRPVAQSKLLIVIGAALVLAIAVGTAFGIASTRANTLTAQLATETGKYDSSQSALDAKSTEADGLKKTVAAAKTREAALTAGEAAATKRSGELDAREAAVKTTETTIAANTIAGDGTFRVGVDIQPGQYHSDGGTDCYWARLNAGGDHIIANDISTGPSILTVQPSDGLIKTSHCAPFTKAG